MSHLSKFVIGMIKSQLQFDVKPNQQRTWLINNCSITKGFSVFPAQVRRNNISMICSYSDVLFVNSNKEEAASVAANCNIKIKMNTNSEYELQHKEQLYRLKI